MWLTLLILLVLFFIYSHLVAQYKKGDHLGMYDVQYTNNADLQKQCADKMPLWFGFGDVLDSIVPGQHFLNSASLNKITEKFGDLDVNLQFTEGPGTDSVQVSLNDAQKIIKTDTRGRYISSCNEAFVGQTVLEEYLYAMHEFLKPFYTIHSNLDIMFGSKGATTPLQYNIDDRMFLYVPPTPTTEATGSGRIELLITPYKRTKYLGNVHTDLSKLEFKSSVNPWLLGGNPIVRQIINPETGEVIEHVSQDEKEPDGFKHFWVNGGEMVYIPPYYWYTIRYSDEGSFAYSIRYQTIMNIVAHTHLYGQYAWKTTMGSKSEISKERRHHSGVSSTETESIELAPSSGLLSAATV